MGATYRCHKPGLSPVLCTQKNDWKKLFSPKKDISLPIITEVVSVLNCTNMKLSKPVERSVFKIKKFVPSWRKQNKKPRNEWCQEIELDYRRLVNNQLIKQQQQRANLFISFMKCLTLFTCTSTVHKANTKQC